MDNFATNPSNPFQQKLKWSTVGPEERPADFQCVMQGVVEEGSEWVWIWAYFRDVSMVPLSYKRVVCRRDRGTSSGFGISSRRLQLESLSPGRAPLTCSRYFCHLPLCLAHV